MYLPLFEISPMRNKLDNTNRCWQIHDINLILVKSQEIRISQPLNKHGQLA